MSDPEQHWSRPPGRSGPPAYGGWSQPGAPDAWQPGYDQPPPPVGAGWPQVGPQPPAPPAASDEGRHGLAVVGIVMAGIALLGVIGLVIAMAYTAGAGSQGNSGDGSSYAPIRGTLTPGSDGAITGAELAQEIEKKVRDEGGEPAGIACPATSRVGQDVTTVCHGRIDGDDWAFAAFFEDAQGSYTLLEF